jgi:hypothetical protein
MPPAAAQIRSRVLFAHVRASTGTPKRDLLLAVDPASYPEIEGSTDSEALFFLALTFGLVEAPIAAVARARHRRAGADDRLHRRRHLGLGVPLRQ